MNRKKIRSRFIHPMLLKRMSAGTKEHLSVIVYSNGTCDHIRQCILDAGGKIKHEIPLIHAVTAEIPVKSIDHIANHHMIQFVNQDQKVFKCMDNATLAINSQLVNHSSYTGNGIGIAILDTGVYPHNDLIKPTNRIVAFKDFVNNRTQPYDDDGHGTHVAGIAAGSGYANEKYSGIAPEANIIGVKVLDETGSGNTSDILAGLQWIIDNKEKYNIKVVNMSLGSAADTIYREDPLAKGAAAAVDAGLIVVAAAGNSGPNPRTITSPGNSPSVITVGAADDNRTSSYEDDFVADFSSRGPTMGGLPKPNVVAPGVDIMSLSNKGPASYVTHSGTSMATPMVAGSAALILEKYPDFSPSQVRSKILNTAIHIEGSRYSEGTGIINIAGMLDLDEEDTPKSHHEDAKQSSSTSTPTDSLDPSLFILLFLLL